MGVREQILSYVPVVFGQSPIGLKQYLSTLSGKEIMLLTSSIMEFIPRATFDKEIKELI